MKKSKKLVALLLCIVMFLGMTIPSAAEVAASVPKREAKHNLYNYVSEDKVEAAFSFDDSTDAAIGDNTATAKNGVTYTEGY